MKTTVQVSLNRIAFNLDENAYQQLKSYIDELQSHFADDAEIIDDIEARIADLLSLRVKSAEQAVNLKDINEIIETIGNLKDIDDSAESSDKFRKHFENVNNPVKKRLYRDTENKVIAGICSGIGHYLNLDAAWVRVTFIVLMVMSIKMDGMNHWFSNRFIFGMPFVLFVYIVLWIVMPRTKTPRQNLEMHGYTSTRQGSSNANLHKGFGSFLKKLFRLIIQLCVGVTLSIVGITCSLMLIAGLASFFGGTLFGGTNLVTILDYIYIGEINEWFAKLLIAVLIFLPVCVLVYLSIKVLLRFKIKDKPAMIILSIIWIIAVIFALGSVISTTKYYRYNSTVREVQKEVNLANIKTLNIQIPDNLRPCSIAFVNNDNNSVLYETPERNSLFICPEVHIVRVDSVPENYIEVMKSANASTLHDAKNKAQSLPNGYIMSDSATIYLQPMEFDKYKKWSSEIIDIFIYLPDSVVVNMH